MDHPENQDLAEIYGRRFRAILDAFRRSDGDPWTAPQIAEASGGELTTTHVYNLKNSRTNNPGHYRLEVISKIMGFPMALWSLEPEEWEGDHRIDPRVSAGEQEDWGIDRPIGPRVSAEEPENAVNIAKRTERRLAYVEVLLAELIEAERKSRERD